MAITPIVTSRANRVEHSEELADVVVAMEVRDRGAIPWYVRLRPWLFCLGFLMIVELACRLVFDYSLSLRTERFDNFPNPAMLEAFVGQIKRDTALRVVVLGDSVVVGPSLLEKDETIPAYLEEALKGQFPGEEIHVWNLGIAGARSTDLYCLLLKVLEARPDMVVLESNFMMHAMDISSKPIANQWLANNLPEVPDSIRALLKPQDYKQQIDNRATWFVEEHWRTFGMRQAINAKLFGVQPRVPYETPNPAIMAVTSVAKGMGKLKMEPWYMRGISAPNFRNMYRWPVKSDSMNGRFYPVILDELRKRKVPAFVYMTPQNPAMMADLYPPMLLDENMRVAGGFIKSPDIPWKDYGRLLPSGLFYDNDHLLASGNRALAYRIARDIAPTVEGIIASRNRSGSRGTALKQTGRLTLSSSTTLEVRR